MQQAADKERPARATVAAELSAVRRARTGPSLQEDVNASRVLRLRRLEFGLTQTELAVRAASSQCRVSDLERGKAMPTEIERRRLARILGWTPQELFPPRCRLCGREVVAGWGLCLRCAHPLRSLRVASRMTQAELARAASSSTAMISQIEGGSVTPSAALAARLVSVFGTTVEQLFGMPGVCACGCGTPTFKPFAEHHTLRPAAGTKPVKPPHIATQRDQFERYKKKHDLIDSKQLRTEVGCSLATISNYVAEGSLVAVRYPGSWAGRAPLLFKRRAIAELRALLNASAESKSTRMRAHWAEGRYKDARPRRGREQPCAWCGKPVYRPPHEERELVFCDHSCSSQDMWRNTTQLRSHPNRVPLGMVGAHWSPRKRQEWLGRFNGAKGAADGIKAGGENIGRPALATPAQKNEMSRLIDLGKSDRAIARIVFGDSRYKNRVLRYRRG
jgi:transcriptional regulator with XRE-family HTH domain